MNPQFIDDMSWAMAEVYASVTDRILINIARHFPYIEQGAEPKELFAYQVKKLAEMGKLNSETADIIAKSLDGADAALREALESAIRDALKDVEPTLRKAAEQGLLMGPGVLPPQVSPGQMQAFRSYYQQSADKLNLVNTVMLESTQAAYTQTLADVVNTVQRTQSILNAAAGEAITGVNAWNEAMHNAVQKMVQNGLTGFIDHAGHRWSPEAYVAMDIRTTLHNTANAAVWERSEEYGSDIYQVSTHNGARPLCYPWQGKLISRTDNSREVPDLHGDMIHVYAQSETSYGQPAGLFGINCGHYPIPFVPGFSAMRGYPQSEEENAKTYAESQQQRALERKLREEKRDLAVLEAQGADADTIKAQKARVKKAGSDLDTFCDETGRKRRRSREYTPIKASFPDKESINPAEFPTETRDRMQTHFGGASLAVAESEPEKPSFAHAKNRADAEKYARQRFAKSVDYNGLSLDNANRVNEVLTELTTKYPINQLDHISQVAQGSVARASYSHLEINGKGLGKILQDEAENFAKGQAYNKDAIEQIRSRYAGKAKLPFSATRQIETLESKLRFTRYGVHSSYDDHVRAVVTHEYGHILSDQYFGMINKDKANPNWLTNWSLRGMSDKWGNAFNTAIKSGDIYRISEYASRNPREFFAECFTAREMGEALPNYIEALFDEVIANGIM